MPDFIHQRHKRPTPLAQPRELVIACAPLRSNVNLSRIVRAAGCSGVRRLIACGTAKVIDKIARDSVRADPDEGRPMTRDDSQEAVPGGLQIEVHRTLPPILRELKRDGYQLVGLEQTTGSHCLYTFPFDRRTVLVIGNERHGLDEELLRLADRVVEIPVYGLPYAHNVATAAAMALYEYCRQWPAG
jgi:tRNA(Leu) C34 or U34 (ribose-2'-O)-methylase TrmL